MRAARTLETAAWLALYGGILIFLFTWNSASPMYDAIFRDRSAADWFPGVTRAYEPGTLINGAEPSPYFAGGWWRPEPEFRWGRHARNDIVIEPTEEFPAGSRIVFHIGVSRPRGVIEQTVDVIVNGSPLAQVVAGDDKRRFEILLPFALPPREPATISFVPQAAKSPLSQGHGLDMRELGVRFHDLVVLPKP
ncbi:MAG TPA: hypothetical protein PK286_11470 [Devosia sp.]|nr:hypothetical protein [Devosia sp.]